MKRLSLSAMGLEINLSSLTSSVAIVLFALTLTLSHNAARQLEQLAVDDMQNRVLGINEMATMLNATLSEKVANYTRLFQSFLPSVLVVTKARVSRSRSSVRRPCAPG